MSNLLRFVPGVLLALIGVLLGSLPAASAVAASTAQTVVYTCHGQNESASLTSVTTERGSLAPGCGVAVGNADDPGSRGPSARGIDSTTRLYDYDSTPLPAHYARTDGVGEPGTAATILSLVEGLGGRSASTQPSGVAAKTADEVADIGHAGVRHQFPTTFPKRSQFYDDIDLGSLSSRTKGLDGIVQQNGNTRYVLRNPGGVGVDRATGLPTDVFTVIRGKDGSVVTMFPGTTKLG